MRVEVIKSSGGYWYSTRTGEQFDVKDKHDNTYYVTVGDDVRHIHEFHCKVVEEKQESRIMKVGDKLKYKGGMNPECFSYKFIKFDEIYEIITVDDIGINVRVGGDWICCFSSEEINSMFTPLTESKDTHYDNTNGSLYLFANQHELNAYEFEVIKRIVRCRKKGEWITDLEKTIRVIELYLKEQGNLYENQTEKLND
jgi:hypothetical protein